ncbi:SIMPL domain-containing protein [Chloroflexota bacterium]
MRKRWLLAIGIVLVLAIVGLAGCSPNGTVTGELKGINISNQQEGISVTGQGKVTVVLDIATLSLGIEAQEASVAQSQSKAIEAMDSVMAALTRNGVAKKDIQTQYFSIHKVTRWDNDKQQEIVIGYRVSNVVTAKIREIDDAGTIIDAVAEAGGDLTRINNIQFSVDDPSDYYEEAREKAMADAKAKARQLAGLAGVILGNPTYISEGAQYSPVITRGLEYAEMAFAEAETPISPGETEISLNLQVVYAIR